METATTRGIQVSVESFYLEEHSFPDQDRYVFAYQVTLCNHREVTVQLILSMLLVALGIVIVNGRSTGTE